MRVNHKTDSGFHNEVKLTILKKGTKKERQNIFFQAGFLFEQAYKDCNEVRSYITNKNWSKDVPDYDFGDLLIADLNFDGREDIAIKFDSGGNGGPFYNFYIQDDKGIFKIDHFLTESVRSFPTYINNKTKSITTQIHANVHQERKRTFQYSRRIKKWKLVKWIMVNY
jgi:hypothetical protein